LETEVQQTNRHRQSIDSKEEEEEEEMNLSRRQNALRNTLWNHVFFLVEQSINGQSLQYRVRCPSNGHLIGLCGERNGFFWGKNFGSALGAFGWR
jgi:hypothetical protein